MKKLTILFLLACSSAILFSCKKNTEECDTATLCMVNNSSNTIHYCWGCNVYSETLAPGEKACREVMGPINASSTVWVDFETAGETRRIEVAKCNVEVYWQ